MAIRRGADPARPPRSDEPTVTPRPSTMVGRSVRPARPRQNRKFDLKLVVRNQLNRGSAISNGPPDPAA
jgi:hypothetical protein